MKGRQLAVQFDDSAHIATANVTGDWSYVTRTRTSGRRGPRNSVSGAVTGTELGPGSANSNHRDVTLTTNVTGAGGDRSALQGGIGRPLFADQVARFLVEQAISDMQRRAPSGICVRVEADPAVVHVKPHGTVTIGGRLVAADGASFEGRIRARAARGRTVAPEFSQGNPRATFTYHAAASRPPAAPTRSGSTTCRAAEPPGPEASR